MLQRGREEEAFANSTSQGLCYFYGLRGLPALLHDNRKGVCGPGPARPQGAVEPPLEGYGFNSILCAKDRLYVAAGALYAVDPAKGTVLWRMEDRGTWKPEWGCETVSSSFSLKLVTCLP